MAAVLNSPTQHIPAELSVRLPVTEEISRELMLTGTATKAAMDLVIDSPLMAQEAADEMNACKRRIVRVKALYDGFVVPAKQILEQAASIFRPRLDDDTEAEAIYKAKLVNWNQKENARLEAERRAREESERQARQKAEQEAAQARARAEEEARQKEAKARQEREARERAEREAAEAAERARKAREAGDAEALRKAEAEQREADRTARESAQKEAKATEQADQARENGEAKATEAHLNAANAIAAAPVAEAPLKIAGTQMRDNWVCTMTAKDEDEAKALIVAEAAQRPELLAYLKLNTAAIGRTAKAQMNVMRIPGFKAENKPIVAGSNR